jgi:hypothetical protein
MDVKHDTEHGETDTHKNSTIFKTTIIKGKWNIYDVTRYGTLRLT